MITKNVITKDAYYDSVTLMVASTRMCEVTGIINAAIMMGTDHNRALMKNAKLINDDTAPFTPNDTVTGIIAESEAAAANALALLDEFFSAADSSKNQETVACKTLDAAVKMLPKSNFTIISAPGRFAKTEANKALDLGLHVLLFSDNIPLEDEISLKKKALEKGLLMMGPDCGTAIINGVSLGFANVVKRGPIGITAAAGTGLQEVSVIIDRLGSGISQAMGTGGRDLKEAVGGMMMLAQIKALSEDPQTKVIVIIGKPPHKTVLEKIKASISTITKPVVVCLMGGNKSDFEGSNAVFAENLENAARLAVFYATGNQSDLELVSNEEIKAIANDEVANMSSEQRYLRGLYSGGTLCYEAMLSLQKNGHIVYSNIAIDEKFALSDVEASLEHTLLDMGDDYFTNGTPHPMIDPRRRIERINNEAIDAKMAVLLLDCVTGYGGHEDPAAALSKCIVKAKQAAKDRGAYLSVVVSVCGTEGDPQKLSQQKATLTGAGAIVMPTISQAVALTNEIINQLNINRKEDK